MKHYSIPFFRKKSTLKSESLFKPRVLEYSILYLRLLNAIL